jgi:hypothetical protein
MGGKSRDGVSTTRGGAAPPLWVEQARVDLRRHCAAAATCVLLFNGPGE